MLKEQLARDLQDAMRARDEVRLRTLRLVQAALTQKEKEAGQPTSDEDALAVVQKQIKQRRESIAQFEAAGREDLARKERDELAVLEAYQPAQLSDEDVQAEVQRVLEETGAESMRDMGRVMGVAMGRLHGRADGRRVQAAVRELLSRG